MDDIGLYIQTNIRVESARAALVKRNILYLGILAIRQSMSYPQILKRILYILLRLVERSVPMPEWVTHSFVDFDSTWRP